MRYIVTLSPEEISAEANDGGSRFADTIALI